MKRELWERVPPIHLKGGGAYKRKRRTKGQVVEEWKRRLKGGDMPIVDTEVREGADDVTEGVPYEIANVEDVETEVSFYRGIRVELLTVKGDVGGVMLWKRKVTGPNSKLGVFLTILGQNTDKWLHKWIIFDSWEKGKRDIRVVEAPAPKAKKTTATKKGG